MIILPPARCAGGGEGVRQQPRAESGRGSRALPARGGHVAHLRLRLLRGQGQWAGLSSSKTLFPFQQKRSLFLHTVPAHDGHPPGCPGNTSTPCLSLCGQEVSR